MSTAQEKKSSCPPEVLKAIYGEQAPEEKTEALNDALRRWWDIYAERKMEDETEEYLSNSLLYDKYHAPRTAPAPDCVENPADPRYKMPHEHQHHGHGHGQGHGQAHSHAQAAGAPAGAGAAAEGAAS